MVGGGWWCWGRSRDKDWAMTLMALHTLNAGVLFARGQGCERV